MLESSVSNKKGKEIMEFYSMLEASLEHTVKWLLELCVAIFCLISIIWYLKNRNEVLVYWPIVNELPSVLKNAHRIHDWSVELANAVGSTIVGHGPIVAPLNLLFTCDPRNVEYIAKTNFSNFPKGVGYSDMFDILGKGIFNVDFEQWNVQRRMANTTFHTKEFRAYIASMSQTVVKDSLLPLLAHVARETYVIDLEDVFLRFSFDSISGVILGRNPNSLSIDLPENKLARAIDDATETIFYRHITPTAWWKFCRRLTIGKEKKLKEAWKVVDSHLEQEITSKKKDLLQGIQHADMIGSYIVNSQQREKNDLLPKGDGFLRDTGLSFVFAGRDSTGTSLAWFFWLVAKNPSVEEKLLEELRLLHAKNIESDNYKRRPYVLFKSYDLKGLVYLHAALCESLRLYPPLPVNHKGVHKEDVLPDGTVVKPGMKILISMYAMGRLEWLWGKDCAEFKPERWIDENGRLCPIPMSKFFTFNAGPRNCIGRDMAFTQMKLVVAAVLFNFHIELVDGQIIRPKPSAVLHMQNGLKVRIKERTD